MFLLKIQIDSQAFGEDPNREIAHILEVVAMRLRGGKTRGKINDIDGREIGNFRRRLRKIIEN